MTFKSEEVLAIIIIAICITIYNIIKIIGYYILQYKGVDINKEKTLKFNINKHQNDTDENVQTLEVNLSKDMDDD